MKSLCCFSPGLKREVVVVLLLVLITICSSCSRYVYYTTDSFSANRDSIKTVQKDSVTTIIRDSVFIEKLSDTVREVRHKFIIKERIIRDTVIVNKTDSVVIEKPMPPVAVEKPLLKKIGDQLAYSALLILAIVFIIKIIKLKL